MKHLITGLILLNSSFVANAAMISGGNATSQEAADTIVDVVFAIDKSPSMMSEAVGFSTGMQTAINELSCADKDVWVNARLTGIYGTWPGTQFDESAQEVIKGLGLPTTINHVEDNGPAVYDFANANTAYFNTTPASGQEYFKAVVTIGDEGLQDGVPLAPDNFLDQADYDIGKAANDIAVANGVLVFSVLGNNAVEGAGELFQALAEGGTQGGHEFNDTGGRYIAIDSSLQYDYVLKDVLEVFCTAVPPAPSSAKSTPVFTPLGLLALLGSLLWFGWRRQK